MKNKLFYLTLFIFSFSVFAYSSGVFAQLYPQSWISSKVISGKLTLGINSDYVNTSDYSAAEVTAGIAKWTSTTAHLSLSQTTFSASVVDFASVSSTTWTNNGWGSDMLAWTQQYAGSTNCNPTPLDQNCTSSNSVTGANIYLNSGNLPDGFWASTRADRRKALIAHELGHALGLQHNAMIGVDSIMKSGAWNSSNFSYDPSTYDVNDINSRY